MEQERPTDLEAEVLDEEVQPAVEARSLTVITENHVIIRNLTREIHELDQLAGQIAIVDQASLKDAADVLGMVKALESKAEEARKASKGPLVTAGRQIDGFFKPLADLALKIRQGLDQRILAHHRKLEAARLKKAEEERLAREAEKKRLEEERRKALAAEDAKKVAETQKCLEEIDTQPLPPVAPTRVRSGVGTTSIRKVWTFQVLSSQAVPRAYLKLDEGAVRRAIAGGVREIPGLKIYQEDQVSTRRRSG